MPMSYVTGDIHGSGYELSRRIESVGYDGIHDGLVIIAGDVGIKYGTYRSDDVLDVMDCYPDITFLVMRGNHDTRYCRDMLDDTFGVDPKAITYCGGKAMVDSAHPNVMYVPDGGEIYEIAGMSVLMIPGAFSVDADCRREFRLPYEAGEQLTTDEMNDLVNISAHHSVDVVISHTCPYSWLPLISDLFMDGVDQSSADKGMERFLDVILDNVLPGCSDWYFGHYHDDRDIPGTIGHMLLRDIVALPQRHTDKADDRQ